MAGSERERRVGAAQFGRHRRMQLRESLDVQLVDHRLVPRRAQAAGRRPRRTPDRRQRERRVRRAVAVVERQSPSDRRRVAEQRVVPAAARPIALRVGIEHELGRVEPVAALAARTARARDSRRAGRAEPRAGSRATPWSVRAASGMRTCSFGSAAVEEAQLDARRALGEDREVHAAPSHVAPSG